MKTKAVVLLSGGLDSRLAVRILQEQDIEVEALNFRTIFTCCQDDSAAAARDLGVRLTVISQDDDYLDLLKNPKYGYGRGANPCIDCRIYMFQKAKKFMDDIGAVVIASGEVVGQRPMSQKKRDLQLISYRSDLDDYLLRPLSAKLLPPTKAERDGLVDREKLYDIQGRSRKGLIEIARNFGFQDNEIPSPSTGCTLTEQAVGNRVHDLIQLNPECNRWDFELIKCGRHLRMDPQTKVVVGRNEQENTVLQYMYRLPDRPEQSALLMPEKFCGPSAMIVGQINQQSIDFAAGLIYRYTRDLLDSPEIELHYQDTMGQNQMRLIIAQPDKEAEIATTL